VERLVGVYRVLKPHLLAVYQDHLARVNRVYEPPTERLLVRLAEDERRHIAAGLGVLAHLAATASLEERGRARQRRLEAMLDGAGGVTGAGRPALADPGPPGPVTLSDDAREFIRLERSATRWPMAEDLARAIQALGDALVARDPAGVGRWLVPGAAWREEAAAPLTGLGLSAHRVVAFAKVGEHRLAKLRLDGSAGTATVLTRWIAAGDGWRAAALDVSGVELVRPA
jgi:hypothetical protein